MGIREERAIATHNRKVQVLHAILDGLKGKLHKMDNDQRNLVARMIGNSIFDMRVLWSGFESEELIRRRANGEKIKRCPEHFFPRQVAGKRIVDHVCRFKGISINKLREYLEVFCQVHYTTSEENVSLKPYQKTDTFISPEHSYQSAGIKLIKVRV